MKKYFILAAAALTFAACSNEDAIVVEQLAEQQVGEVPVAFDSYVNRGTTRAGAYGDITTDVLQTTATSDGFAVFGYYTDNNDYDQFSIPNFMYNQWVYYDASKWIYSPIKYWPNEHGSNAISEDEDRVTFFAYAPRVSVEPTTGKVVSGSKNLSDGEYGIVGMTSNTGSGDPKIKYVVNLDPAKCVDLLWGVRPDAAADWYLKQTGAQQTSLITGFPWLNVQRPKATDQRLMFDFKHALAKLNVTVDAFVDGTDLTHSVAANNKIFIRSITFTGFATKGALNLNNTDAGASTAKWMSFNCISELETGDEVTIYDGRKDGKEGVSPASNEKVTGLNPAFIEDGNWTTVNVSTKGVTNAAQNLFNSATATAPIYVIPTSDEVDVTIVYEVEAQDGNLPTFLADGTTHGSRVKNTITQKNVFSGALVNGKAYTLNLHLGMNSVKFNAGVTGWVAGETVDVNLPAN